MKNKVMMIFVLLMAIGGCVYFLTTQEKEVGGSMDITTPSISDHEEMTSLYYYNPSLHERYLAYQKAHPDYSVDQVVWQVNIDMDKEVYTEMTIIDPAHENDIVLLVNKHFRLRDDYVPESLVTYNGYYEMTPETKAHFEEMVNAAKQDGITLNPGSTYRSVSYQRQLYQSYVNEDGWQAADTYSARAGSSEHHTGRAIDLVGPDWTLGSFGGTSASDWIIKYAYQYGFIIRYQKETEYITGYIDEPWHITYVGKEAAEIMHLYDIDSLEEYYVKYVMYQPTV